MFLPLPVCVKSSEVLVSLVSCTINDESVLNLRLSRCMSAPVPCTTCDERCSVYLLQRRSPVGVLYVMTIPTAI